MLSGKIWGNTRTIIENPSFALHQIFIKRGAFCSMHKHEHRFNGFLVISGRLQITVKKNDYDLVDVTELGPGDFTVVPPGEFHQFRGLEVTTAVEYYWTELDSSDILRENHGGVDEEALL